MSCIVYSKYPITISVQLRLTDVTWVFSSYGYLQRAKRKPTIKGSALVMDVQNFKSHTHALKSPPNNRNKILQGKSNTRCGVIPVN